jgi:hypothetical protein
VDHHPELAVSKRKDIIRVGDTVVVVNCKIVKRVGYPLVWTEIVDGLRSDPRVIAAYEFLRAKEEVAPKPVPVPGANDLPGLFEARALEVPDYFAMAAAKVRVEAEGFGGNERSIHYKPLVPYGEFHDGNTHAADITGHRYVVVAKKLAKTGKRFPPSSGVSYSYDGGEPWYEDGGLEDCKTHVLLHLTGQYWIEACNVRKIDGKA